MQRAEAPAQALWTWGSSTRPRDSADQRRLLGQKTEETVSASPRARKPEPGAPKPAV